MSWLLTVQEVVNSTVQTGQRYVHSALFCPSSCVEDQVNRDSDEHNEFINSWSFSGNHERQRTGSI